MKVKIKKLHPDAVIPKYAKEGDAGMDFTAISAQIYKDRVEYGTGLAIEIPEGYVGLIFPRSSIFKTGQTLSNSVGVIDSGYRGEIKFVFYTKTDRNAGGGLYATTDCYEVGQRIGQIIIVPYPEVEFEEVEELETSERGDQGYGSTGR